MVITSYVRRATPSFYEVSNDKSFWSISHVCTKKDIPLRAFIFHFFLYMGYGGDSVLVHGRSRMTVERDPRIPTMPGRSSSSFHTNQAGIACTEREAPRVMLFGESHGELLHPEPLVRKTDFGTPCCAYFEISCSWMTAPNNMGYGGGGERFDSTYTYNIYSGVQNTIYNVQYTGIQ